MASVSVGAEAAPTMKPLVKLDEAPANTWVPIAPHAFGIRQGSAFFWSQAIDKFVLAQGLSGDERRKVVVPYDVQAFYATTGTWENRFPPGKEGVWGEEQGPANPPRYKESVNYFQLKDAEGNLRPTARLGLVNGFAVDPDGSGFYIYVRGYSRLIGVKPGAIWRYDVKARTWTEISPAHEIDSQAHEGPPQVIGARLLYEPVNRELLLLGGHAPNVIGGSAGNWAFSLKTRTWNRLTCSDPDMVARADAFRRVMGSVSETVGLARRIYYEARPAEAQGVGAKADLAPRVAKHAYLLTPLQFALAGERDALVHARRFAAQALARLEATSEPFKAGTINGEALRGLDEARWALDRAVDCLASEPPPRANPAAAFDPVNKVVVLFGGDHFDYAMGDTWIYDPAKRSWRQVFPEVAPPPRWGASLVWLPKSKKLALVGGTTVEPRFQYFIPDDPTMADVWLFDVKTETWRLAVRPTGQMGLNWPTLPSPAAAGPDDVIVGLSLPGGWPVRYDGAAWAAKIDAENLDEKGTRELGVPPGSRTSRALTRCRSNPDHRVYDPVSYDAAEPGDPKAVEEWLAALKPNTWTEVPRATRHVPQSEWGTAVYDPDRDQMYYWTGGHMSDPANAVHTYHPGINRWSIPYVAEIPVGKGLTFNNRPDCKNHTYHNYAYDPVSKKVVAATYGGTGVYDPDTGAWTMTLEKPFRTSHYTMNLFTTPKGVMVWAEGFFGGFNAAEMKYEKWPIRGEFKRYLGPDANGACWDPKRKVCWLLARTGWTDTDGQVFKYDLDTGEMTAMNPINAETLGKKAFYLREVVYVPALDLLLTLSYTDGNQGARLVAYDPTNNRWVHLNVLAAGRAQGPVAMIYDTKRDLVWCLSGSRLTYVLRLDPKTLEMTDTLPAAAKQ